MTYIFIINDIIIIVIGVNHCNIDVVVPDTSFIIVNYYNTYQYEL